MSKGTAVVTGAANGIGQAYAQRLATDGFDIAVADVGDASETKAMIEAAGRRFFSAKIDVTSPSSTAEFANEVAKILPPVTALVNNAGIYPWKPFAETDYDLWRKVASTTFWLNTTQMTSYVASKGGVIGFTRALAGEVGASGVTVNVIAPGLTNTKTMRAENEEIYGYLPKVQAIPRVIEPSDIVGVVSFLCSQDSAFVTGQTIAADGGNVRN